MTHGAFKFTKNNWSRDGSTYWYRCSQKKATGCPATATVKRVVEENTDGTTTVTNYLLEVATPEVRVRVKMYLHIKISRSFMPSTMLLILLPLFVTS